MNEKEISTAIMSGQGQVGFNSELKKICEQIEIECFDERYRQRADEIALIICEVSFLRPDSFIRIGGSRLPAPLVKEVYSRLNHEHIMTVIENFDDVKYRIRHIKTYLRTALYNAVFESGSRTRNDIATFFDN